jgi:hypothetical protein
VPATAVQSPIITKNAALIRCSPKKIGVQSVLNAICMAQNAMP